MNQKEISTCMNALIQIGMFENCKDKEQPYYMKE